MLEGIADVAPDIVLIGNLHGAALAPATIGAISARWPTFVFLHDLWWLTGRCLHTQGCGKLRFGCDATCPTPDEYPKLEPGLIRQAWIEKRAVLAQPNAPVLLAHSNWAQSVASEALFVTGNIAAERVVLGLTTNFFYPRDKVAARARLGLPQDKFIVLFTTSDLGDFRKGTDRLHALVQGFDHPDFMFVAVGHGAIDGAHAATKITTLPYRKDPEDVAELDAAVDVILGASRAETFGQIYTEAATCGTPSVAFANSGVREAIVEGVTGNLADVETVDALRDILLRLFSDSHYRDSMSRWGRLHAENEWSLEASYHSLFQVWRRHGIVDRFGLAHKISFSQPNADDLLARGLAHLQAGRFTEAEHHFQRLLTAPDEPRRASALYYLGMIAHMHSRPVTAIEFIDQAIQRDGTNPTYHTVRGIVSLSLGRPEEALKCQNQALALDPGNVDILNNRGLALATLERFEEALECYDQALAGRPDFVAAVLNRGNALEGLQRFDEALASFDRALTLAPAFAPAHHGRGEALRGLRRSDEAVASYDRALALDPTLAMARNSREEAVKGLAGVVAPE